MVRKRRRAVYRSPAQRTAYWDRKMRGDVYSVILDAVKPMAREKFAFYQSVQEFLIEAVRDVVMKYAYEGHLMQEYMWYAQKLWYYTQRYKSDALQAQADALFLWYRARDRDEDALRGVALKVGITISTWDVLLERLDLTDEILKRITEETVHGGVKKALAETLETVETNPMETDITYDAKGRIAEIVKTDLVTGVKKRITIEYDPKDRPIRIIKELVAT